MFDFIQFIEQKSEFNVLKSNKIPLTDQEREIVFKKKAIWHFNDKPTSAVWKSKKSNGEIVYGCNTHRCYQIAKTLNGAISKFHKVVKGTS